MNRLRPPEDHAYDHPTYCPYCREEHEAATSLSNPGQKPSPEDISLCANCGEFGQFDDKLQLIKISDELRADIVKDPRMLAASMMIKGHKAVRDPAISKKREDQLSRMVSDVRAWIAEHKDKTISIQYNFPSNQGLISTIDDAIRNHAVSVNADAMQMFTELGWLKDDQAMPTVFMLKAVMDTVTNQTV